MPTVNPTCAWWCIYREDTKHQGDSACWGIDHDVPLTLEEDYPHDALPEHVDDFDPPRITAVAYRGDAGRRNVVYLHLYRPSENKHLDLDSSLRLTVDEARRLSHELLEVIEEIEQGGIFAAENGGAK